MATDERSVHVAADRIGTWVSTFATRHDGANVIRAEREILGLLGGDGSTAQLQRWPLAPIPAVPADGDAQEFLDQIVRWCAPPEHIGLILIRRGGHAVGLGAGTRLTAHRTGRAYVQSRTAAGGTSQQRFARRRANQADALVGKVIEVSAKLLLPAPRGNASARPQVLVLGGDRRLAEQVAQAPVLRDLADLPRRIAADLPDPRFAVLNQTLQWARGVPVTVQNM